MSRANRENENDEEQKMSVTANIHERDFGRDGGTAISERPEEDSHNSTPPGTVGDLHDIRSEQHAARPERHRFVPSQPGQLGKLEGNAENSSNPDDSARAQKSHFTKVTAVANVSAPIPMNDTSGALAAFKMSYG